MSMPLEVATAPCYTLLVWILVRHRSMAVPQRAVERRLAAIMMTDIVGYSRLMALDDVATLQAMDDLRRSDACSSPYWKW